MDVARKILILSREAGLDLDLKDVKVQNILPQSCLDAGSLDEFFSELEKMDDHFEQLRSKEAAKKRVPRFIARMENGATYAGLEFVDQSNPFFTLDGSDNMIAYTTNRYLERPLVIRGPGAGAEVTAAGVFAEIIGLSYSAM
jgi:aspartokinase/homoserine dehydrogenase 1